MEYEKELDAILENVKNSEGIVGIGDNVKTMLDVILDNSERSKGLLTVLITSLAYKTLPSNTRH